MLAVNTLFFQGHRYIAGALFTKGIAHPQAPCSPGALVPQTCMPEQAQLSSPTFWPWGEHLGTGTKAGAPVPDSTELALVVIGCH